MRRCTMGVVATLASATLACRNSAPEKASCTPTVTPEVWVERRFPAPSGTRDTTRASLSIGIAGSDSVDRLPPRSMISVVIAGPVAAERPDTVRLITAEQPNRAPLWRGDQVRPGTYVASLTTKGYDAGPREFPVSPGERVEVDVKLHHAGGCAPAPTRTEP